MRTILWATGCVFLSSQTALAGSPNDFDFDVSSANQDGMTIRTYLDRKTGQRLVVTLDSAGTAVRDDRFAPDGHLKQRNENLNEAFQTTFYFSDGFEKHEWTPLNASKIGMHRVEISHQSVSKKYETYYDDSVFGQHGIHESSQGPACHAPPLQAENIIKDLVEGFKTLANETYRLSPNRINQSAIKVEDCEDNRAIAEQLLQSLSKGAACLAKGSASTRLDLANLLAIFSQGRSITIRCEKLDGAIAKANSVGKNAPGMSINKKYTSGMRGTQVVVGTMFHEMLHWLHYVHDSTFDVPYLAEKCCFLPDAKLSRPACALLNQEPRPSIDSKKYLVEFTRIMVKDDRASIAANLLTEQMHRWYEIRDLSVMSAIAAGTDQLKSKEDMETWMVQRSWLELMNPRLPRKALNSPSSFRNDFAKGAATIGELGTRKGTYEEFQKAARDLKKLLSNLEASSMRSHTTINFDDIWTARIALDLVKYEALNIQHPSGSEKKWPIEIMDDLQKQLDAL